MNLSRVKFVCVFENNSITIAKNQPPFKIKESNCFEEGMFFEFEKVWFVCVFEKHSVTIQNHATTIQKVIISFDLFFLSILHFN